MICLRGTWILFCPMLSDGINFTFTLCFFCVKSVTIVFVFNQEAGMQMEKASMSGTRSPIREEIGFLRTRPATLLVAAILCGRKI